MIERFHSPSVLDLVRVLLGDSGPELFSGGSTGAFVTDPFFNNDNNVNIFNKRIIVFNHFSFQNHESKEQKQNVPVRGQEVKVLVPSLLGTLPYDQLYFLLSTFPPLVHCLALCKLSPRTLLLLHHFVFHAPVENKRIQHERCRIRIMR